MYLIIEGVNGKSRAVPDIQTRKTLAFIAWITKARERERLEKGTCMEV